jgi:hypothetical protein
LVAVLDVMLQPTLQELQDLNAHGDAAGFVVTLKHCHLFGQGIVFRLVFGEIRKPMLLHQPLFVNEMNRCALDQAIQNRTHGRLAPAGAHRDG